MLRDSGNHNFPIWLIGDSEPARWREKIDTPFDSRHPIRHNIWTSIADIIQDNTFRDVRRRIDTSKLFIRNAIGDPGEKPKANVAIWSETVQWEIDELSRILSLYRPRLVLSFGAFSFEFVKRAVGGEACKFNNWTTARLGEVFANRVRDWDCEKINHLPLLHRSIAAGAFLQSHDYFVGRKRANYFEYVGEKIAAVLLSDKNKLDIWI